MTTKLLLTELCGHIERIVSDYVFPAPSGESVDARVFLHGLPQEQTDQCFPFVIVRWAKGTLTDSPEHIGRLSDTVSLALGVHSPRGQREAGILLAELIDCLRLGLWKKRVLAGRFELSLPMVTTIPDPSQRWHEYHLATIETVWDYIWPSRGLKEMAHTEYPTL